jgi:hypothetical protein
MHWSHGSRPTRGRTSTKGEVRNRRSYSGTRPCRLNQNAADLEMHLAGHEELCYWTVKATVPTFALTEPDVPVTVIV